MSYVRQAELGLAAVQAKKWDEGVSRLSAALAVSQNPVWLIARSKALIGLGRFQDALDDANLGWHTAYDRNRRTLLAEAQHRRAVAYFRLGQYANADACCIYTLRLIEGKPAVEKVNPAKEGTDDQGFYTVTLEQVKDDIVRDEGARRPSSSNLSAAMGGGDGDKASAQLAEMRAARVLRTQILYALERLPPGDEGRRLTTTVKPEQRDLVDHGTKETAAEKPVVAAAPPSASLRIQEFQSNTTMGVSIFSKGVNKEKLHVQYLPTAVVLDAVIYPDGTEKPYRLDLFGEIDTGASQCAVTPNKVELTLKKKTAGKWAKLTSDPKPEPDAATLKKQAEMRAMDEFRRKALADAQAQSTKDKGKGKEPAEAPAAAPAAAKAAGPSYPTSSKTGAKNWDAIVNDEDDVEEAGDVNAFFKQLYKDATPDQQRAMMKSFTESNGTSLSTSWDSVKEGKVECVPPPGVEAKPYDQ